MSSGLTVVEDIVDQPDTWDEAAHRVVHQIVADGFHPWDKVSDLRKHIDYLIDQMGPVSGKNISEKEAVDFWLTFGRIAINTAKKGGFFTDLPAELIEKISEVLVSKQKDYGPQNIARFGRAGLLIRCHDKIARLENLLGNDKNPQNETVVDNFIDVVGYSSIGVMWERGWFLLPLKD